jgi:hypothetical protein
MTTPYAFGGGVVERVVLGERPAPHRRPQVVGLQPQHGLEDLGVEVRVEAAGIAGRLARARSTRGRPGAERRVLVVDEEPAVLHRRRALAVPPRQHVHLVLPGGRHVVPPVPGRDADPGRDVVRAVDRAALVAARDDEGPRTPGIGRSTTALQRGLPLAGGSRGRRASRPRPARRSADCARSRRARPAPPPTAPARPADISPRRCAQT